MAVFNFKYDRQFVFEWNLLKGEVQTTASRQGLATYILPGAARGLATYVLPGAARGLATYVLPASRQGAGDLRFTSEPPGDWRPTFCFLGLSQLLAKVGRV